MNSNWQIIPKAKILRPSRLEMHIYDTVSAQMDKKFRPHRARIQTIIRNMIYTYIKDSPEAEALRTGGTLAAQLGLHRGSEEAIISRIARITADHCIVRFSKIRRQGKKIVGKIRVRAVVGDYSDVLSVDGASYISEPTQEKIPWLDWLLRKGPGIIVSLWGVLEAPRKTSRSGEAVMLPILGNFKRAFRITPTKFSGTEDDNWLTRAILANRDEIQNVILSYLFKLK